MAIQQAPVSIGHPLVGDMAAGLAALADVVACLSHKQEINAVRLAESGGQGWLSSVVSDERAFLGVHQAAPLVKINGSIEAEAGPESVTVIEAAQLVRTVLAWTVIVVTT